ncbi:hypothetical protein VD0002_g8928 [Verticillium dahliae]|uniref:UspA domain-containing protein n=1 Tax=Verticillium dahliae TaxID=27337 RepID=A0AA45AP19_VERDA|nr:Usp domain-containing protein [Verticillium dahliae]PNH33727.1 hypothetical protein BJF96_g2947 [Verticillium dahliae]PNH44406.1 hypothetical protein VD0003_g9426 [Verticillium dahliae]PNH58598.1 hypothetical protein VD0002_g8928 [Verticillium dahliae]
MARNQPMSMEAMLDEERKEVLALLEGRSSPEAIRSTSPYTTPRSPVRSMLDVVDDAASTSSKSPPRVAPIRSMLDVDSPPMHPVRRSMLDIDVPAAGRAPSGPNSPVESRSSFQSNRAPAHHLRSMSDTSSKPSFGPRASIGGRLDPTAGYQFSDINTNNIGQALPKRNTQAAKFGASSSGNVGSTNAMAEALRGSDLSSIILPTDRTGRHGSISGPSGRRSSSKNNTKSKSPHGRMGFRSPSPNVSGHFQQIPGTAVLDDGRVVDISNAYRKLSDANLAFSAGSLSGLAHRKSNASDNAKNGRLAKDYLSPDGEDLEDSSDEEPNNDSSDDEGARGRKLLPESRDAKAKTTPAAAAGPQRQTRSLLAAAEEERIEVSTNQPNRQPGYRSLFDEPEITVTGPSGERAKPSKPGVHPSTAFDQSPTSGPPSAVDSDEEADLTDIKRAQKLAFSMTPVISTPDSHRTIRIVYRGEFEELERAADEEGRTLRKYLVATDLSDESSHALEWTIGTVLRDGDTLLAIYCVDEETGIYADENVLIPDEVKAHKEQAAAINAVTAGKDGQGSANPAPIFPHISRATALGFGSRSSSPAPASRDRGRAEEERQRAVEEITERVTKLLRKTKLQVRVVVEVLHCKNPKHLITEVIDLVSPTLVILGSRGRSALKGVILGSFSNYLVTKSSVPVMVARKRLRKHSKYKKGPMGQVNNLSNPASRSLANAKID